MSIRSGLQLQFRMIVTIQALPDPLWEVHCSEAILNYLVSPQIRKSEMTRQRRRQRNSERFWTLFPSHSSKAMPSFDFAQDAYLDTTHSSLVWSCYDVVSMCPACYCKQTDSRTSKACSGWNWSRRCILSLSKVFPSWRRDGGRSIFCKVRRIRSWDFLRIRHTCQLY